MNTEANYIAKAYWQNLSKDNRLELLQNYQFWLGFSDYLYEYLPEDLKTIIILKTDINDLSGDCTKRTF